jgi:hypothetical protein
MVAEVMTEENCVDCILGRKDGYQWCPAHYSWEEDNRRAIELTGVGITK